MAKLKGPLFSLGAAGKIAKTLVYFGWKGLNVVREYVVPANPRTAPQTTQRGYLTAAVAAIHTAQAHATQPINGTDVAAYALWASVVQAATTWFNQAVRNWIDQLVAGLSGAVYRWGQVSLLVANQITFTVYSDQILSGLVTAGTMFYGTSKTALINSVAATMGGDVAWAILPGLTTGVKYFMQFRPTAGAGAVGANSGIYYGTCS